MSLICCFKKNITLIKDTNNITSLTINPIILGIIDRLLIVDFLTEFAIILIQTITAAMDDVFGEEEAVIITEVMVTGMADIINFQS